MMIYMLLSLAFSYFVPSLSDEINHCDYCDILLGGLAPVHGKHQDESKFGECSDDFNDFAMPRVEAMLFAVDQINNDSNLLNGVKLGITIQDTCGIESVATQNAKAFVSSKFQCSDNLMMRDADPIAPYFAGVIGGMYSSVTIAVATFLQPWYIPQVSPASTSIKLSDTERYKYFARTVPSDTYQNRVIVDILERLNWKLISTIVSDGSFPEQGINEFHEMANEKGICNAMSEVVPNNPTDEKFTEILCKILLRTESNVMVLFTNVEDTRRILATVARLRQHTIGNIYFKR